jgi:lipid-A-disaccharide synthase-like uncharacterized protein
MINSLRGLIGFCLVITSIFDCWKYVWQAQSIKKVGTAKGHSRKFINVAILNDIIKLSYGIIILDLFIMLSSVLALITMGYNFYIIYKHYPYKKRGLINFKRPSMILYFVNSIVPNRIRKRL